MGAFKTLVFVLRNYHKLESAMGQNRQWGKKGGRTLHWSITSWLREHFKLGSIAVAQSHTVEPSFSDHIWSLEAMTTDKRVLIPIYEMSAKEIEGGQADSCNSNWWWCLIGIFEAVERNRYFHWQFCVISDPCM